MDAQTQLLSLIIGSLAIATIETVLLLLARRDVKLGLKKWFLTKLGRRPIKARLQGPDGNEKEYVIGAKGKETLKIDDGIYMIRPKALRKSDDGLNVINFTWKNALPYNPEDPKATVEEQVLSADEEEVLRKLRERIPLSAEEKKKLEELSKPRRRAVVNNSTMLEINPKKTAKGELPEFPQDPKLLYEPIDVDDAPAGTNPNLLDKFVEYIYLVAKAEALKRLGNLDFWVKAGAIAAAIAALGAILAYNVSKGDVLPAVNAINAQIAHCQAWISSNSTAVINI